MNNSAPSLSPFQIFVLSCVSSALGTLCLAPFLGGGADGSWIYAVLIASAFAALMTAVYSSAVRKHRFSGFAAFLESCLPRFAARLLLFLAGIFFIAEAALCAYYSTESVRMYLLDETPTGVLLLALVTTACILADPGLRYLARCCELLLMLLAVPLALLLMLCITNIDVSEAVPALLPDRTGIVNMLPAALLSCGGSAAAVIFIAECSAARRSRAAAAGFFISAAISSLLYVCAAGIFTTDGTSRLEFPFIEAARSVTIGRISLTERFDTVFISIMLTAAILQLGLLCSCSSVCLADVFGLRSPRCFTFLILPAVFASAYYALSENVLSALLAISLRGLICVLLAVVPVVSIAAGIFMKGVRDA